MADGGTARGRGGIVSGPLERLRHHVTGAIERGEREPVTEHPAAERIAETLHEERAAERAEQARLRGIIAELRAERDTLRGDVRRVRVECNKAERDRDIYHAARNELARQRDEWRRRWSALGDATEELRADRDACKSAWQLTADAANLLAEDLQRVRGERDTAERVVREARDMLVDHTITDEIAAARALAILEGPRDPADEK